LGAVLARKWLRSARMWSTVAGLIVFLDIAWHFPQSLANYRIRQLVVEFAVEIFLALTCAGMVAALATTLWLIAGGLRARQTRAHKLFDALETTLVVLSILGVIAIANVRWLGFIGIVIPSWIKISLVAAVFVLACIFLAQELRSSGTLEKTSRRLEAPSRRFFLALWLGSLGVALWGGVRWRRLYGISANPKDRAAGETRPNFILITFDALSAEDMSLYGYRHHTTPNMDRLAARSIVFDRYYSAATFTSSAVTSILTGKNVFRHGWYQALSGRIPNEKQQESLGTVLKANGYTTAAIVANIAAHPMHLGLEDGFDVLPSPALPKIPGSDFAYHLTNTGIGRTVEEAISSRLISWAGNTDLLPGPVTPYAPDVAFAQAESCFSKVKEPNLLWVHLVPPHFPYNAPAPFSGRFLPGPAYRNVDMYAGTALSPIQGDYDPRLQSEMDKIRLRYDEYIAYVDNEFGAFHARLEQLISGTDTVTIVSADHGENFNHGFWGHGGTTLWNSSMHIPLIINLPGGKAAGTKVSGVAGEVDLLPTVLDLAGIAVPSWAEGRTLRRMWEGGEAENRTHIAINVLGGLDQPIERGAVAIVSWPDKYILDIESGRGNLFDLANDPEETHDLSDERPGRASELRRVANENLSQARRNERI
jgi:arylsulfatase A-like enzyme